MVSLGSTPRHLVTSGRGSKQGPMTPSVLDIPLLLEHVVNEHGEPSSREKQKQRDIAAFVPQTQTPPSVSEHLMHSPDAIPHGQMCTCQRQPKEIFPPTPTCCRLLPHTRPPHKTSSSPHARQTTAAGGTQCSERSESTGRDLRSTSCSRPGSQRTLLVLLR